jgi:hypothetical protein
MDDAVSFVQIDIFHAKVSPFAEKLVQLLATLRLGSVQRDDLGGRFNLENASKPIVVG